MPVYIKRSIQNIAIFLLVLVGIKNIFLSLPFTVLERFKYFYGRPFPAESLLLHHLLSFITGVLILLLAYHLYKRVRLAWIIEIIVLVITLFIQYRHLHSFTFPVILVELFILAVLIISYDDFSRVGNKITIRKGFLFAAISIFLVILNSTVSLYILKESIRNVNNLSDAFWGSVKLMFFMDTSALAFTSPASEIYADLLIGINWVSVIAALFFILKPLIYNPISDKFDKARVRDIVNKSGQNPMSYLALENDKKYFFSSDLTGVCAYDVVNDTFIVCGDMACAHDDGFRFLSEITAFCKQNGYSIIFVDVTDYFAELYKLAGFGITKFGEDACFKLEDYNLSGNKVAKVRAAINHANNAGIVVKEYKPTIQKEAETERSMNEITAEWLKAKNGYELEFMVGGTGLSDPMDRRYFYAEDETGKMLGFVVYLPYLSGKGYLADVTRRRQDAPQGVLEKIIYDSFMIFKDEGVIWGSMGLSPLYNVRAEGQNGFTERILDYIYQNLNGAYGFKDLHHAKEKYSPTEWIPRYAAYYPAVFTPAYAYALVKVQVKKGITKMIMSEIKKNK